MFHPFFLRLSQQERYPQVGRNSSGTSETQWKRETTRRRPPAQLNARSQRLFPLSTSRMFVVDIAAFVHSDEAALDSGRNWNRNEDRGSVIAGEGMTGRKEFIEV